MKRIILSAISCAALAAPVWAQETTPTSTAYTLPTNCFYYGLDATNGFMPETVMLGPVFTAITYTNTTKPNNSTFLWTYNDTEGTHTSTSKNLSVTYGLNYTDEASTFNNFYPFPLLAAESPTTSPAEFIIAGNFQAGGAPVYNGVNYGITIADPVSEGVTTYSDGDVPLFGYGPGSDEYWTFQTFGDYETMDAFNWSHLETLGDFFYCPNDIMVIFGVRINAYGKITNRATFTAGYYPLNSSFIIPDEPVVSAKCTYNDITITPTGGEYDLLSLYFKFDEPILVDKNSVPYFVMGISGFRDAANVEYFNVMMTENETPTKLGLGWMARITMWNGEKNPLSWMSTSNFTPDEKLCSPYIMLDAAFPWLTCAEPEVELTPFHSATVLLDSYYDGSELEIYGLPEWITAEATGRYGNTELKFRAGDDCISGNYAVTVIAPGVSQTITVTMDTSGVDKISAAAPEGAVFTLDGRRVDNGDATTLQPGIYVRIEGGKAVKVIQK